MPTTSPNTSSSGISYAAGKKLLLINHGDGQKARLLSPETNALTLSPTSDLTTSISPTLSSTSSDLEKSVAVVITVSDDDNGNDDNNNDNGDSGDGYVEANQNEKHSISCNFQRKRAHKSPSPTRTIMRNNNKKQRSDSPPLLLSSTLKVTRDKDLLNKQDQTQPNIIAQTYSKNCHSTTNHKANQNLAINKDSSKKILSSDKSSDSDTLENSFKQNQNNLSSPTTASTTSNGDSKDSTTVTSTKSSEIKTTWNNSKSFNLTKPLVINHALSSSTTNDNSDNTKQEKIVSNPSLSSQLILSSVIRTSSSSSSHKPNNISSKNSTIKTITTTTASTYQLENGIKAPSTSDLRKNNKNQKQTMPSGLALTSGNLLTSTPSIYSAVVQASTTPTQPAASSVTSPITTTGNAVSARLMDMGKKLLVAAKEGQVDDVRQLVVNAGAPFTSDWLGTTALHLAAQNGHAEVAEILLNGGVNRDAKTKLDRTALHHAAQNGSLDVVDLLLIHGSDVNARDMLKMTPLHWAVERGHYFVAERLLLSGADVTAKSKFQLTPLDIAHNSECFEMIQLFKNLAKSGCVIDNQSCEITKSTASCFIDASLFLSSNNNNKSVDNCETSYDNDNNDLIDYNDLQFDESHDILDEIDYRLTFENNHKINSTSSRTSLNLDMDEPCIDLVELELNTLKFEPDFFLSNDDEEDETRVEYLMKVVEELQKENRQLRQRVKQLQTTSTR